MFSNFDNLVSFSFTSMEKTTFYIHVHSPDSSPLYVANKKHSFKYEPKTIVNLSYRKLNISLLPHPYESQCKNYESEHFENQQDCIDKCLLNLTYERCGNFPPLVLISENARGYFDPSYQCYNQNNINSRCKNNCLGHDCNLNIYETIFLYSEKVEKDTQTMVVRKPKGCLFTFHTLRATFDLCDLFVYVGNASSCFLGFNMFLISKLFKVQQRNKLNTGTTLAIKNEIKLILALRSLKHVNT